MLVRRLSLATPLALCWLALIVHASLYPFSGWRSQDVPPWAYLSAPWSPYWSGFDVWVNVVGYLPLGFLLALALLRSGRRRLAWLAGLLAPALLSLLMEGLQSYLPQRVPSRLDLLLNAAGGAAGALLALLSARLRLVRVWDRFREEWLSHEPPLGYVVLLLWPLALLYPTPVPYGLGQFWLRAQFELSEWLQDTPFAHWLPAPVEAPPLSPLLLALAIALSLVAPLLLGFALLPRPRQRIWLQLVWSLAAPAALALSTVLTHGMARVWDVFSPPVRLGLALAFMLALAGLRLSCRAGAVLLLLALGFALGLLNGAPESPYYAAATDAWSGGPFMRVHGLSQWLGWLWPYAALGVGLRLALRVPPLQCPDMSEPTSQPGSYYERHIFFCLNQRDNGQDCCAAHGAQQAFDHCKARVKELGLAGPGQVRVNKAGCLDRCAGGPVAVVYPEAVWYTFVDQSDIDEIVESHLRDGRVVERLLTPPDVGR